MSHISSAEGSSGSIAINKRFFSYAKSLTCTYKLAGDVLKGDSDVNGLSVSVSYDSYHGDNAVPSGADIDRSLVNMLEVVGCDPYTQQCTVSGIALHCEARAAAPDAGDGGQFFSVDFTVDLEAKGVTSFSELCDMVKSGRQIREFIDNDNMLSVAKHIITSDRDSMAEDLLRVAEGYQSDLEMARVAEGGGVPSEKSFEYKNTFVLDGGVELVINVSAEAEGFAFSSSTYV